MTKNKINKIKRKTIFRKAFENENYPKIMYFLIILVSLLLFFNLVSLIEKANTITGYAINNSKEINQTQETEEMYTAKSYMMFYIIVILLVASAILISLKVKKIIWENIQRENKEVWL